MTSVSNSPILTDKDLNKHTKSIADAVIWMRDRNINCIQVICEGGGDTGVVDRIEYFRTGVGPVDDDEIYDSLSDELCEAAAELATWDWINDSGGSVTLEIQDDGRYSLTGGRYESLVNEATPLYGTVSETPATVVPVAEPDPKASYADFGVVGRIPGQHTECFVVRASSREDAIEQFTRKLYENYPAALHADVMNTHKRWVHVEAVFTGVDLQVR